ncbi:hypothetical protein BKA82DRAFT_4356891 [Pisolithus tinctorius]|nr:hypothetical protein BKA82DRAFT_4356891 [Pisolithus tinctorius]
MFAHLFPFSTFHSPLSTLVVNPSPGECLAWSLRESSWYGLAVGRADKTPSHGGATSYSATRGVEDCQLSLATLESIFYFPKETQLFTLPAGTLIGFLLLTFLLSWLRQHSLHYLSRPMVFRGYPQLRLVHLRQDSVHFSRWDANRVSLARFLTFLVNAAFSPLSIKADGLPWLPPVPSSPSDTRVFSICPPVYLVRFLTFMVNGTFSSTSITPGERLVRPLPRARGLVPFAALKGLEPSKVILLTFKGYAGALITIVSHLELSAVDAATLADILLSRSQREAPSFPSSSAPSMSSSCQEGTAAVPSLPFSPIGVEVPTPPISIHLMSADTPDSATVLVHGHPDVEPSDPSLADECWHTSTGVFFTVTL